MKVIKKYKFSLYTFVYFFFAFCIVAFTFFDRNKRVDTKLQNQLQMFKIQKDTVYTNFKIVSKNIYFTIQEDYSVISLLNGINEENKSASRKLLYEKYKQKYERMRNVGVQSFQFHLPSGESFIRFFQPSIYGDNLKDKRYSIAQVHKTKKEIEGFEIGRTIHGFRFVYPLFFNDEFIGSVEISMSADFFHDLMKKRYKNDAGILINKDYVQQSIWEEKFKIFYNDCINNEGYLINTNTKQKKITLKNLGDQLKRDVPFVIYDKSDNTIKSFLPVRDIKSKEVVAYLFNSKQTDEVSKIYFDHLIISSLLSFFFILIYLFLHKDTMYKIGLKKTLLYKTKELRKKERALMQQSRLAQMGELLSMIAHQWRQPLSAINSTANSLSIKVELDSYDKDFFKSRLERISTYAHMLSATVDDFRSFFYSHKEQREITLEELCDDALQIIHSSLSNQNITVVKKYDCNKKIFTYPSQLRQVVLNLLKNSQDVLLERKIKDGQITLITQCNDNKNYKIIIKDNAGGIDREILDKIYDPYFTTKDERNGSGLGLYMSKIIIQEHCKGSLSFKNEENGAVFTISLST